MSFSAQISAFSKGTQAAVEKTRRAITYGLFSAVIFDTPVLTGRLRGNWFPSEGNPSAERNDELLDPAGTGTVAKVQELVDKSSGDKDIWLTNNLPYAARIEFDGWSHTKAPEGMVRKNIARFNRVIEIQGT